MRQASLRKLAQPASKSGCTACKPHIWTHTQQEPLPYGWACCKNWVTPGSRLKRWAASCRHPGSRCNQTGRPLQVGLHAMVDMRWCCLVGSAGCAHAAPCPPTPHAGTHINSLSRGREEELRQTHLGKALGHQRSCRPSTRLCRQACRRSTAWWPHESKVSRGNSAGGGSSGMRCASGAAAAALHAVGCTRVDST